MIAASNASGGMMEPDLSMILPSYRNANVAVESVGRLCRFLGKARIQSWEIIVVDDGGGDFPAEPWPEDVPARLIVLPRNTGKGAAVSAGMAAARGRIRIFTDADLPYGMDLIPVISNYLRRGFHMVIGDRTMPSSRYTQSLKWQRRVVSRFSSRLIGSLVTGGFFDTQCGLKGLRGDVADLLFPMIRIDRFMFDVELIYISLKNKIDIKRIPVRLQENELSSVRILRDSLQSTIDLLRIKSYQLQGFYECASLDQILIREIEEMRVHELGMDSELA